MVVLCLDAIVTETAMVSARRPPQIACLTEFCWDLHRGRAGLGGLDKNPIVGWRCYPQWIFVLSSRGVLVQVARQYLYFLSVVGQSRGGSHARMTYTGV